MDKILIITDFRPPKEGEIFVTQSLNGTMKASENFCSLDIRPIVGAELEVPEGAKCLAWSFRDCNKDIPDAHGTVILPRKPKVKKYQFVHLNTDPCHRQRAEVTGWMTIEEAVDRFKTEWYYRVEGSEIEVEE